MNPTQLRWPPIIERAKKIVAEMLAAEGVRLTLRGLFYRLVSEGLIPNTKAAYQRLSRLTAEGRRGGTFPDLHDAGREIDVPYFETSPAAAVEALHDEYRLDRTEGQPSTVILGVEKRAQVDYLTAWFGERGLPAVAMAGYTSQTLVDDVKKHVAQYDRPAVMLYAGDFDPSGADMVRDLRRRLAGVDVRHIGLTAKQVRKFRLPDALVFAAARDKAKNDARAASFVEREGGLFQTELEALPTARLHRLYEEALAPLWDDGAFAAVQARELRDRAVLARVVEALGGERS